MPSFFSFHGRIGRSAYWMAVVTCCVLFLGGAVMIALAGGPGAGNLSVVAGFLLVAAGAWVSWATTVTRLHDMGRSGFFALVGLVPFGSLVLMAFCGFAAGTPGMNHYGPPPGVGGSGYLDEAMAAFEEPDFERRSASASRKAAAYSVMAGPAAKKTPPRAVAVMPAGQGPASAAGRGGFGRRGVSAA